jgi:DNA-binding NarL/FixJ family response regulator
VPLSTITRTEIGSKEPQLSLVLSLCVALDVSPGVLVEEMLAVAGHTVEPLFEAKMATLTPRQREVLEGLSRAESNDEIAGELRIGVETVRTHTSNILRKLGVRSRRALIGITEHR